MILYNDLFRYSRSESRLIQNVVIVFLIIWEILKNSDTGDSTILWCKNGRTKFFCQSTDNNWRHSLMWITNCRLETFFLYEIFVLFTTSSKCKNAQHFNCNSRNQFIIWPILGMHAVNVSSKSIFLKATNRRFFFYLH